MYEKIKNPIRIRPPKKKIHEGVKDLNAILQPSFITLIIGKPGSGKSHLLYELILNTQMYYKKFDRVLFCAPTLIHDDLLMDKGNWRPGLDLEWLNKKLSKIKPKKNVLVVLDDVIGEIKVKENDALMMKLFFNRRHLIEGGTVSFFITTQKYIVCPTRIRSCLTSLMIFKVQINDWKVIRDECVFTDDPAKITYTLKILNKPYNFLYVRLDTGDIYEKFEIKIV